ncbi:acetyl-CoA carboxylase biotin carboxyl carrier protein [Geomicrobium sp. JCM 19038]|uniref:acetyl-CoA carboxylase biotin carboxyl carrier protein n=1 Tax=Geomicrobium sp. JCM 19038 TaxID=1460635 RepID=UPI00045F38FF|nr:acetyl-CoA carboxylase biotin carboxyl carrier protein [Geomicrobium sp. JCM 19038]GAK09368.1 biotin carboxyl carrier protein of acetyl-CoA carboxylase [Geomicrobium sp. JCM 19038]
MYSIKEIKELIEAVNASEITQLEVQGEKDTSITIKKETKTVVETTPAVAAPSAPAVSQPVATPEQKQEQTQAEKPKAADDSVEITSPMVGTFYRASSPDADPYVQVGDQVHSESIVCIVEAMKLMNELEAETKGEIVEILVENGELVDYGQPLFRVIV